MEELSSFRGDANLRCFFCLFTFVSFRSRSVAVWFRSRKNDKMGLNSFAFMHNKRGVVAKVAQRQTMV